MTSWDISHRISARIKLEHFKERLKNESRKNSLPSLSSDPLTWIFQARPIVDGVPRNFDMIPFWLDIYKDICPQKMIIGGRQTFKSTYITDILACEVTSQPNKQVGYITYDEKNRNAFSKQRFRIGTLLQNDILTKFPRNNLGSVGEISMKNDSTAYFMTHTNGYRNVEGKSLSHCFIDEAQYQDIQFLGNVLQTMMQTKGKTTILGIGGVTGTAYEKEWNKTDQREWFYDDENWRDRLQFDASGLVYGSYLIDVLKGKWIAQKPENSLYHGYHIPQTIFANIPLTIQDAIDKYKISHRFSIQYQKENMSYDEFEAHVMGNFFKSAGNPLTPAMIRKSMEPYREKRLLMPSEISDIKSQYGNKVKISMGVDFGSGNLGHTVITILIHWLETGVVQMAYLDKRKAENQISQTEMINELFRNGNCDVGVGDLGYGHIQVKMIQSGGINQSTGKPYTGVGSSVFFGCRTVSNQTQATRVDDEVTDEHGQKTARITIDKTAWIMKLVGMFEGESKFVIPFHHEKEYETNWLIPELSSISQVRLSGNDSRQNAKLEFNHPPDSAMAIIYAMVGLEQGNRWFWVSA